MTRFLIFALALLLAGASLHRLQDRTRRDEQLGRA